ncbi:leucine rich repeat protein, partial [Gorgonomyces haynaldii]
NLSEPLPPSLRLLKSLESLSIDSSKFAQFPEIVTALPLLNLTLQSNTMNGQIPQSIGNMASLVQLNLQDNQLSGPLPIEIGRLINLESLDLSGNPFSGQIPQELGQLQKLVQLYLF